jgi:hypothetical protein
MKNYSIYFIDKFIKLKKIYNLYWSNQLTMKFVSSICIILASNNVVKWTLNNSIENYSTNEGGEMANKLDDIWDF